MIPRPWSALEVGRAFILQWRVDGWTVTEVTCLADRARRFVYHRAPLQ